MCFSPLPSASLSDLQTLLGRLGSATEEKLQGSCFEHGLDITCDAKAGRGCIILPPNAIEADKNRARKVKISLGILQFFRDPKIILQTGGKFPHQP